MIDRCLQAPVNHSKKQTTEENTDPLGFRFKPFNLNKSLWFLFTNQLEESIHNNRKDKDRPEQAKLTSLSFRWALGSKIIYSRFCPEKYCQGFERLVYKLSLKANYARVKNNVLTFRLRPSYMSIKPCTTLNTCLFYLGTG